MYSYLQFSLTSAASAISMAAKWYQKVVSRQWLRLERMQEYVQVLKE